MECGLLVEVELKDKLRLLRNEERKMGREAGEERENEEACEGLRPEGWDAVKTVSSVSLSLTQ